jgi:hypothetical protein
VDGDGREHGSPVELDANRDAKGSRLTTDGHSACHRVAARLVTQPARPADGQKGESLKRGAFAAVDAQHVRPERLVG